MCGFNDEGHDILLEFHSGYVRGHVRGKAISSKVMQLGLWCPTLFEYTKEFSEIYDVCHRVA